MSLGEQFATLCRWIEEAEQNIRSAIAFHVEGMRDDGLAIPAATTHVIELEIV